MLVLAVLENIKDYFNFYNEVIYENVKDYFVKKGCVGFCRECLEKCISEDSEVNICCMDEHFKLNKFYVLLSNVYFDIEIYIKRINK